MKRDGSSAAERRTHNSRGVRSTRTRPIHELVGELSPSVIRKFDALKFVRHKTARSLWLHYIKPIMDQCGLKDPNAMLCEGKYTADQMIANFEDMGYWGYANPKEIRIDVWWGKSTPKEQVIAMIAHELEHIVKSCRPKDEENRADLTGAIAVLAVRLCGP